MMCHGLDQAAHRIRGAGAALGSGIAARIFVILAGGMIMEGSSNAARASIAQPSLLRAMMLAAALFGTPPAHGQGVAPERLTIGYGEDRSRGIEGRGRGILRPKCSEIRLLMLAGSVGHLWHMK
jgi:hypothetical protein